MNRPYADLQYYQQDYLLGRKQVIPDDMFLFFEKKARRFIDDFTFNRVTPNEPPAPVRECACALAEYLYTNEGYENKSSESIAGHSASYRTGIEYQIIQTHLQMTGLLYRGE